MQAPTDQEIKTAFTATTEIIFLARPFNYANLRKIVIKGFNNNQSMSFDHVMSIIGITPHMLRPVFNNQAIAVKWMLLFSLGSLGLDWRKIIGVKKPVRIDKYKQLGYFPLAEEPFHKLANIIGKSINVVREDGMYAENCYSVFTVHPTIHAA